MRSSHNKEEKSKDLYLTIGVQTLLNQIKLPLISSCLENLLEISLQLRIFSGTYVTTKLEVVQSKNTIDLSFMFMDPTNRQYRRKPRKAEGGITNIFSISDYVILSIQGMR